MMMYVRAPSHNISAAAETANVTTPIRSMPIDTMTTSAFTPWSDAPRTKDGNYIECQQPGINTEANDSKEHPEACNCVNRRRTVSEVFS